MKKFFKRKPKQVAIKPQNRQDTEEIDDLDEAEFQSFFSDVLKKFPSQTKKIIMAGFETSKEKAVILVAQNQQTFDRVFDQFLENVDQNTRNKSHRIIHAAALTAAIIGFSPIPFSDAFLLVPIQLTMMARLHKLFGQSWSEGLGKSISKEIILVGFGRSVVGNALKLIPGVGTVAGGVINTTVAFALTEALGWVTVKMLNDGEDLFDQMTSLKGQVSLIFNALMSEKKQEKTDKKKKK